MGIKPNKKGFGFTIMKKKTSLVNKAMVLENTNILENWNLSSCCVEII